MPRSTRFSPPDSVHHVFNRGNERRIIFENAHEYAEFLRLVVWAKSKVRLRIIAYCIMPNHWHFVVWPEEADSIQRFFHRLCTTHAIKRRRETNTVGYGHVYQGRYHAFRILSQRYLFNAMRYVEGNAYRSGLAPAPEAWPWSSASERTASERLLLDDCPLELPTNWNQLSKENLPLEFIEDFHKRLRRH